MEEFVIEREYRFVRLPLILGVLGCLFFGFFAVTGLWIMVTGDKQGEAPPIFVRFSIAIFWFIFIACVLAIWRRLSYPRTPRIAFTATGIFLSRRWSPTPKEVFVEYKEISEIVLAEEIMRFEMSKVILRKEVFVKCRELNEIQSFVNRSMGIQEVSKINIRCPRGKFSIIRDFLSDGKKQREQFEEIRAILLKKLIEANELSAERTDGLAD
jgi:hypothetical protein